MKNRGLFTSISSERSTPQGFYDKLNEEFGFTLDPCATAENAKCERFFSKENDGLSQSWQGEVVFCNPPFGREIGKWVRKAHEEAVAGATVVLLIASRTDTSYWHDFILPAADEIRFIRGRLYFDDGGRAPFPSAVVVFRPSLWKRLALFGRKWYTLVEKEVACLTERLVLRL